MAPPTREFFTVATVARALREFRPSRRSPVEAVPLADALGRVPAREILAHERLPGFDRSTVDGYAVHAADTFGASEGIPAYLQVTGAVRMGAAPEGVLRPGSAIAIPTGGMLPAGADAVVMVEHTQTVAPDTIEVVRPAPPGEGIVRGDEDAAPGTRLAAPGRPLRAHDLALLAAGGVVEVAVHARPRVAIIATGDEVMPPTIRHLDPGQVRDALSISIGALVREAGGEPWPMGIVPDDRDALRRTLADALTASDLVVVSAGSSVGGRDETAAAVGALPSAEIWCHGLAIKPGKPTLLARSGETPIIGLPGNPRSALVVFRHIGMPLVRRVGGWAQEPRAVPARARLARDLPSAAGRLDIVQVRLVAEGTEPLAARAEPIFGPSALLSVLTEADGYVIVPEEATGLGAGSDVNVWLYG